jgi:hypothetical protein
MLAAKQRIIHSGSIKWFLSRRRHGGPLQLIVIHSANNRDGVFTPRSCAKWLSDRAPRNGDRGLTPSSVLESCLELAVNLA